MKRSLVAIACFLAVAIIFASCSKAPTETPPQFPETTKGVYIVNEGNFGRGNASLTYYDLGRDTVYYDVFAAVNGRSLGDVANSMAIRDSLGFIVVNNSDKIEVIRTKDSHSVATIHLAPGSSLRQIVFVGNKGYVTNLYTSSVAVIDLANYAVVKTIPVGENPEGIVFTNGKLFVANSGFGAGTTISVIDPQQGTVIDTISVAFNPTAEIVGADGNLYVLCTGSYGDFNNPYDDVYASMLVINPQSGARVDSLFIGGHPTKMALGKDGVLYVAADTSVVSIDTHSHHFLGTFVGRGYYGVGADAVTGDVYLLDAKDYASPGEVFVFSPAGTLKKNFSAGVIPGSVAFVR